VNVIDHFIDQYPFPFLEVWLHAAFDDDIALKGEVQRAENGGGYGQRYQDIANDWLHLTALSLSG
jgi:hypothetical protein